MENVLVLKPKDGVRVDQEKLTSLYMQLGEAAAEDVICRAMEELAVRLSHCERLYREDKSDELRKSARSLTAIADQIGMGLLAQVAVDVTRAIDDGDRTAQAATLSRLLRIGENSLTAIWDLQDLSV
jgi:hypothetical protein